MNRIKMNKAQYLFVVAGLGLSLCAVTKARELQFTTLPEVVRTTVIHKYNVVSPEKVVRVVELPDNIYELTVVTDSGNQVVYVKVDGTIVERPSGVTETRETTESREGAESGEVNITLDQVRSAGDRYEFVQDQGPDAIYIDRHTNKRVIIKGAAGQGPRDGVRTREENKTNIRENETNQTENRTNEESRSGVRTEDKDQKSGAIREKTEEGSTNDVNKNMREEQKTQHDKGRVEQKDQENRETVGNGQEQKSRDASGNARSDEKNAEQRNMRENQGEKQQRETNRGEQQSQEKSKGESKSESKGESKGKAKPSPGS
jgi:hypothetical protein